MLISYTLLSYGHLLTVLPAVVLGTILMVMKKGTPYHRLLGKFYLLLMLATGTITLFMPARVGPQFFGHFGWIHAFSFLALYSVPNAYLAVRAKNVRKHQRIMIGLYVGGILLAGAFALMPGRLLHQWLFR